MVRTRIAPSPTGEDIHIGNLYTALINWVWAKKNKGKFIIRIEDTDQERLVKGSQQKILETINAFGLHYDEAPDRDGPYKPYRQSERLPIYKKHVEELIRKGAAYYCNCSKERLAQIRRIALKQKQIPKYDKHCLSRQEEVKEEIKKGKPFVIRLNVPENKEIKFRDVIRGEVKIMSDNLDDQVLMKSDGFPTYHLAVVVDDYLMKISHVIRAEEWLSSTPKHVLLYQYLDWPLPQFVHLPVVLGPDKSKLSKRHGAASVLEYRDQGYLPQTLVNYLSFLGWNPKTNQEILSLSELIKVFD